MPLTRAPVVDRHADAAYAAVAGGLEAQEVDVLDDLQVAELHQRGVVLVAVAPLRLQPEGHGSRLAGEVAGGGNLDLRIERILVTARALERNVRVRGQAGGRLRLPRVSGLASGEGLAREGDLTRGHAAGTDPFGRLRLRANRARLQRPCVLRAGRPRAPGLRLA